jgi:23S rRNA (cytidine1920-2'-O)/16S rRNA (cytidine1409-2'-O)-methyltransferase
VHRLVLEKVIRLAMEEGLRIRGLTPVPFRGPAGNVEFFIHLSRDQRADSIHIGDALDACLSQAETV